MYKSKTYDKEKDEGEFTAAMLLNKVVKDHTGFIDIVVYDALACNSVFIKECIKLGIDEVVRVKKTTNLLINEVKSKTNKKQRVLQFTEHEYKIDVYESIFYMKGIDEPIRYIKYAKELKDGIKTNRTQVLIITTCMDMKLESLYRIIKARWDVENNVFNKK